MSNASILRVLFRSSCVALLVAGGLASQAMSVERRAYTRLELLRTELALAWLEADAEAREAVASLCAAPVDSQPFLTVTRALLIARGQPVDDAALYRGGILAMPLPEVVDQDVFDAVHVTAHAPRIVPEQDGVRFRVELATREGDRLAEQWIDAETELADVLRFRATTSIPMIDRDAGEYRVRLETWFGDAGPRPFDLVQEAPVWVLPTFKVRAEALPLPLDGSQERVAAVAAMVEQIPESRRDPLSRALLFGALWQVERAYRAEPRLPGVDPVVDLRHAERIFANLVEDRPALDGIAGRVVLGLPLDGGARGAEGIVQVSVDLPPERDADVDKPLVVVLPGAPAWDDQADRPISARTVAPSIVHDRLSRVGFDADGRFHVAVLESPGRFASAQAVLRQATRVLRELLPVGERPVIWIGAREGGYAVSRAVLDAADEVDAIVLVAGSGFTAADLAGLDPLRVMLVPAARHGATLMLERLAATPGVGERVRALPADAVPWPIAMAVRAAEIEAFVREIAGDG